MHKKFYWLAAIFLLLMAITPLASASGAIMEGDQGSDVAEIQSQLSSLGYYGGNIDGDFGSATMMAVKAFQRDRGLEVDGVVGAQTYRALVGRDLAVSRSSGSTSLVRRIVQTSLRYRGVPYVFGGTSPDGFDCSGFTRFVFAQAGVYLPRTADEQFDEGRPVSYNNLQPGDIVFFSTYAAGVSHSGIYIGDGQFVSATSSRGVAVDQLDSRYWGARYIGARRVL